MLHALTVALLLTAAPSAPLVTLPLEALLAAGPGGLAPSPRAQALAGQRVRLVGHMAHLEEAPGGAFYLTARPVECDEGGGGTGDLPPEAVRVEVRSAEGAPIRWLPGLLEVTGRFEVGPATDAAGQVAWFRLVLDQAGPLEPPPDPSSHASAGAARLTP